MNNSYLTIGQLNETIKGALNKEFMLQNVTVLGEVSGFRPAANHAYFVLKDSSGAINISDFNYRRYYIPKDGEQVLIRGKIDYYSQSGKLSLIVYDIIPYGAGMLAAQLAKLKADLEKRGFFDQSKKKLIPQFPKKVCVITSKTGAVIRDIITTTRLVNNIIDIYVYDVRVQGPDAHLEIADALRFLDDKNFDVIIIARGGGSLEDLMPFNSEEIVYAIYNAKTPIISAVGHETDFSLSDFAADVRAATPTAAAQIIAYNVIETKNLFNEYEQKLLKSLDRLSDKLDSKYKLIKNELLNVFDLFYSNKLHKLEKYFEKIPVLAENRLNKAEIEYKQYINKIENLAEKSYIKAESKANVLFARLDASNPTKIFTKGYMLIDKDGQKIQSIKQLNKGDLINIKTVDGKAKAEIIEVNHEI